MFSCSNGGRLCVCEHIKADHDEGRWCVACDCDDQVLDWCYKFTDRAPASFDAGNVLGWWIEDGTNG